MPILQTTIFEIEFDKLLLDEVAFVPCVVVGLALVVVCDACCAYIACPAQVVETTTTAENSDNSISFAFRSLNKVSRKCCHRKKFNRFYFLLNNLYS